MQKARLALDLGGTKVACAFLPGSGPNGRIVEQDLIKPEGNAATLENFLGIIEEVKGNRDVELIGIDVPGDVHDHTYVGTSPNIPWLKELDLGTAVSSRFGIRTWITNDMEAAGLGEAEVGRGLEHNCFWLFTFSTGIGGVFMVDKKPVGKEKGGGEPGHICLMPDPVAPLCGCGRRGCWEALASGSAINRRLEEIQSGRERLPFPDVEIVGKTTGERVRHLDRMAEEGRDWALSIYHDAAYWMGHGLADIVNLTGPDAIVYMGSLGIKAMSFMEETIRAVLRRRVMSEVLREVPILESTTILQGTTIATNALRGAVVVPEDQKVGGR